MTQVQTTMAAHSALISALGDPGPMTPVSADVRTYGHISNPSHSSLTSLQRSQPTHVQAIHDFHHSLLASTAASNPGTYLAFQAGDVIRVHTRDPSGWWDGEISGSTAEWAADADGDRTEIGPRRGWFPSNYVREMGWEATHQRNVSNASFSTTSASHDNQGHSRNDSTVSHQSRGSVSTSNSHAMNHSHYRQASSSQNKPSSKPLSAPMQSLLQPIVQSLSLLETAIHSNRKSHIQPSTACVISAIRSVLSQTDCLSKEANTLTIWPILAKERKIVLVELSKLVACARSASGNSDTPETGDDPTSEELEALDALAKAARSVFSSLKRFLQLANDCGVVVSPMAPGPDAETIPTPVSAPPSAFDNNTSRKLKTKTQTASSSRMQEAFRMKAASIGDLRAARRQASSPPPPLPSGASTRSRTPSQDTPISATFPSSGSGKSSPVSMSNNYRSRGLEGSSFSSVDPTRSEQQSTSDDHGPYAAITTAPTKTDTRQFGSAYHINEAISIAEDALLSVIAAFIGHIHSHSISSHPSSHAYLIELTRETIDSVRELLTIVETVGRHVGIRAVRPREIESLRVAKDSLYDAASRLVAGSESVANAPFEAVAEDKYDVEKAGLLQAATGTLRTGTECVRLVKLCLPDEEVSDSVVDTTPKASMDNHRLSLASATIDGRTLGPRSQVVGVRGVHTLSGLHRKASSLNQLQKKYQEDGSLGAPPIEGDDDDKDGDEDDEQEVVRDINAEEDVTLRPVDGSLRIVGGPLRPQLHQARTSPGSVPQFTQGLSMSRLHQSDIGPFPAVPRSRATSLSSPAPPPRIQHRSPSRSADLDKFTGDYPTPQQIRRESHYTNSSTSSTQASHSSRASASTNGSSLVSSTTSLNPPAPISKDDTSLLGYLKTEVPSMGSFPRLANLRIDIDESDGSVSKSIGGPARPAQPIRSVTMPNAGVEADVRFWVMSHDYSPREIAFNSEGAMTGGTLEVIVEKMTPHDTTVDAIFWSSFFLTFRLFTTPIKLLETIVKRYDLQPPVMHTFGEREKAVWIEKKVVPVRLRIYNLLKTWLDVHWRSESDDIVLPSLYAFAKEVMFTTLPAMAPRLMDAVRKRQEGPVTESNRSSNGPRYNTSILVSPTAFSPTTATTGLPPTPIINQKLHNNLRNKSISVNITEFDALELARQFTLMESKLFIQIKPEDLLMTGKKSIPQLKALSTLSNQVTGWVADGILNEMNPKRRAELLKFYIKLADKCLSLNNFSTMFAVLAGLNSSTILRLKKTWDALSTKYRAIMDRLRGVIEHTKNHATYRARLRDVAGPCLPFLGLILTDITFTSDGNPNTRPSTLDPELQLINQDKYTKLAKIAMDFQRFQQPFNYVEVAEVQDFLQRVLTERGSGSLDALYRKSLMLEPRQVSEKLSSAVEKPGWLGGRI